MKIYSIIYVIALSALAFTESWGQVTESPRVEERSVQDVTIKRVELTDRYTIVHLQYVDRQRSVQGMPIPGMQRNGATIWLDPETRLYKPGEINTKFKLIKAENIPTKSQRMPVKGGQVVDFVAYFERLSPGIEVFDFYEGRATNPNEQTWNFYGIHIKNPKNKPAEKPVKVAPKPAPQATEPQFIENPDEVAEEPVVQKPIFGQLQGTIYDALTKEPIPGVIQFSEAGDSLSVRTTSGAYRVGLDLTQAYTFRVGAKGYFGEAFTVSPADSSGGQQFTKDLFLRPIKVGESLAMSNIYFATGKYSLLPESTPGLERLVQLMEENHTMQIRIEGHTDNVGDFDKNLELSRQRAEAVKDYMVQKGIDASRIEAKGYGSTRPVAKDQSAEERSRNRRVELVITQE
ncbi:outer membrane protein OmpA-like peptidoglycan-associated protein [Dyadobacter jejuensis]|uniref:Outer membrane protein OmpA-like peptidoglycan-associated protein n=1 Tax=Dyadobacter jejuensis TaxID=1082580 RepID=A0A316AEF3_9BACT|nr:OmpA family protein [Dyadobacter jejuensis]PWJ55264.1 outer membrane protein OmpA-like peptidoglycan-associated protein [Dyadobacter jejuensis]